MDEFEEVEIGNTQEDLAYQEEMAAAIAEWRAARGEEPDTLELFNQEEVDVDGDGDGDDERTLAARLDEFDRRLAERIRERNQAIIESN